MTEIKLELFTFKGFELRAVNLEGQPYFVGKDVAELLGYSDRNKAIAMHVEDEDKKLNVKTPHMVLGQRGATLINKKGVSALITKSKLLTERQKSDLYKLFGIEKTLISRKEIEFLQLLEDVISPLGFTLERQYVVGSYRLDGFIHELGIAVEYDEAHHKRQKDKDKERELYIQNEIGCTFVRVSEDVKDSVNVGYVIKALMDKQ